MDHRKPATALTIQPKIKAAGAHNGITILVLKPARASSGPKALSRVLDLLTLLARHSGGMSLSEISAAMAIPKTTLLDTLRGLSESGHLLQDGNRFRLGGSAYRMAGTIMASWSPSDTIRYYLRDLAAQTRESVGFAIADWEIGQVIYTDGVNSTQPVHYAMRVGLRAPLYASAAGRVLLAHSPAEKVAEYLAHARLKSLTAATRTSPDEILSHLAEIRALGYCASFGEMLKDTASIAMPVQDPMGNTIGALMLAAPLDRMRAGFDKLLERVLAAGRAASGNPDPIERSIAR